MMISRSNNKKRMANKRTIIGVVFLLILFLILGRIGFPSLGGGASKPVVSTGGLFKNLGNGFSVFFSSRKAYENKISELEGKLATLETGFWWEQRFMRLARWRLERWLRFIKKLL